MIKFTRPILDFYVNNEKNQKYLKKHFTTNNSEIGIHVPGDTQVVAKYQDGRAFIGTVDEYNTYEINNFGLRGEIYKDAEVLASGCSITFGLGVPESARWTNFLSNRINKNIMNLGNPGASVESICNHIIQYCMNNTMPKEIFCLFPDLFRRMVVVDKEFYDSEFKRESMFNKDFLQQIYCNPTVRKIKDIIFMEIVDKKYIENSVSPHQLILNSINSIYNLETFCLLNNIKLVYTTWDLPSSDIIKELTKIKDFKLKNFVPFYPTWAEQHINTFIKEYCNLNHDSEFKNNVCWHEGSDYVVVDYKKVPTSAHPGIHFQYHIAEFFYNLSK